MAQAIQGVLEIEKESDEFSRLLEADVAEGRPLDRTGARELSRKWIDRHRESERHFYRLKPQQDLPYSHFLMEHCRKWGVQVLDEPLQLESKWRHFQLSAGARSNQLVVNSLGGARLASRFRKDISTEKMKHWM